MALASQKDVGSEGDYVEVRHGNLGLDRSEINSDGHIELPELDKSDSDDAEQVGTDQRPQSGMVNALKQRKHHAAVKIRQKLHISKPTDSLGPKAPVLANSGDPSSDSRLKEKIPVPDKHTLKDFVHAPISTVVSKVTQQGNQEVAKDLVAKEIPHGIEVDLINAHDAVEDATTEKERLLANQDVSRLMKERQSAFVRWSLDRHVTKVRLLPRDLMVRKSRAAFESKNTDGVTVVDWKGYGQHLLIFYAHQYGGQYIGAGSDPPAPSKETIKPNIERMIVATSPFQEIVMKTRSVYRWENVSTTTKYLLIYFGLWYCNLLLPGIMSYLFYLVIERRLRGDTLEDLRADIEHRENTNNAALSLTEFVIKRGDDKWVDEIIELLGPWLMVQLADLANFFESVRNFYEWRKPHRTKITLTILAASIAVTVVVPVWLLVKMSTFSMGFSFFTLFPLSINYPDYRLLVSPAKRLLWNIPTHTEWAVQYIQAEGARIVTSADPDVKKMTALPELPIQASLKSAQGNDYGFYTAHENKSKGHLIIGATSCRFVSSMGHNVHFNVPFSEISRLEKQDRVATKNVPSQLSTDSGQDLKLVTKIGREHVLTDMVQRNEAFSQILGFSKASWQVVW